MVVRTYRDEITDSTARLHRGPWEHGGVVASLTVWSQQSTRPVIGFFPIQFSRVVFSDRIARVFVAVGRAADEEARR
jgi:hypothetical protein